MSLLPRHTGERTKFCLVPCPEETCDCGLYDDFRFRSYMRTHKEELEAAAENKDISNDTTS